MKTHLNWTKLVTQGRVKAVGIPWSREEEQALREGMTPEDVRAGLLTKKEVEKAEKKEEKAGEKSLIRMTLDELKVKAKELEIEFDEGAVTRQSLMSEISKAKKAEK